MKITHVKSDSKPTIGKVLIDAELNILIAKSP